MDLIVYLLCFPVQVPSEKRSTPKAKNLSSKAKATFQEGMSTMVDCIYPTELQLNKANSSYTFFWI